MRFLRSLRDLTWLDVLGVDLESSVEICSVEAAIRL
jgi:hypothetical protein